MKIQSSDIQMTSQHIAVKEESKSESLKVWVGNQRPDFEKMGEGLQLLTRDNVDLSQQARSATHGQGNQTRSVRSREDDDAAAASNPVSKFISVLMELLTGKKIKLTRVSPQVENVDPEKAAELTQAASQAAALSQPQTTPQQPVAPMGFGLEYNAQQTTLEAELMSFSTKGVVRTTDGKQVDFSLEFTMQRVVATEQTTSIRMGMPY